MAKLNAREAAILRMALDDEARQLGQGMMNTSTLVGAEYPRMLYRAMVEEERRAVSQDKNGKDREWEVTNSFGGYLCEVVVADSADEAEALASAGWDTSPAAAHGAASGLVSATTAKDDEIAALRAQIEELTGGASEYVPPVDAPRRGPGRPPRQVTEGENLG